MAWRDFRASRTWLSMAKEIVPHHWWGTILEATREGLMLLCRGIRNGFFISADPLAAFAGGAGFFIAAAHEDGPAGGDCAENTSSGAGASGTPDAPGCR